MAPIRASGARAHRKYCPQSYENPECSFIEHELENFQFHDPRLGGVHVDQGSVCVVSRASVASGFSD